MHLVFATSIVPDGAPATGYEIANAAIIDALRRAGVRVTVLGLHLARQGAGGPRKYGRARRRRRAHRQRFGPAEGSPG